MFVNEISPNKPLNFSCEKCDFKTYNKKDYARHLKTKKHIGNVCQGFSMDFTQKNPTAYYACECGKSYKDSSGLWRHKKKCNESVTNESTEEEVVAPSNDMFLLLLNQNMELIKQNQEFKNLLAEQNKNMFEIAGKIGGNMNNSNNTTNNNTNNFNLQFFLNEQCKDALNIGDFIEQIKLQLSDLDMIGRVGYVEGMSKIFLRNLKALDVFKRPIHCSDLKRETLYIKDKDSWEKENGENIKITRAIKEVEHKNIKQLPQWREENPSADDTETKKHMEYQNILLEAMGGSTLENDDKKREKIIRNIAKEVVIEKKQEK
jgi:hypothetical protein